MDCIGRSLPALLFRQRNSCLAWVSGTIAAGAANTNGGLFTPTLTVSDGTSTTTLGFNWAVTSPIAITPINPRFNTEGDTVSWSIKATDPGGSPTYAVSGLPPSLSVNAATGLITGTISWGDANVGTYAPTVTVTDGSSSTTLGFSWSISSAIAIRPVAAQSSSEGDTVSLSVAATDLHSGQTLSFFLNGQPTSLSIDQTSGLITGTIPFGAANNGGSFLPQLLVSDGTSNATLGFVWSVASAISIRPTGDQFNAEGDTVALTLSATDRHSGQTLTYALSGQPASLSIDAATGVITGTVAAGAANDGGLFTPTLTVTDGTSTTTLGFNWGVTSPIAIVPLSDQSNTEGDVVAMPVTAIDGNSGQSPTFQASGLPTGLTIDSASGLISGTVAWGAGNLGGFFSTITVSDAYSHSSFGFNWSIASAVSITAVNDQQNSEGDTVTLSLGASDLHSGQTLNYALTDQPPGVSINASSGLITGTISWGDANNGGAYTPQLLVGDGTSRTTLGFNWSVSSAISIPSLSDQANLEGDTVSVSLSATDSHSGKTLTYALLDQPAGVTINAATGLISGTVAAGAGNGSGIYAPTLTVSDGTSSNSGGFNWSVTSPISIRSIADQLNSEGATVSFSASATVSTSGQTLTFSLVDQPNGITIDPATGVISGTIAAGDGNNGGSFTPSLIVSDSISSSTLGFNWTVSSAIHIANVLDQQNSEGATVTLALVATGPSGLSLTYSLIGQPDGLTIDPSTGVITGTIAAGDGDGSGSFSPEISVSDGPSTNTKDFNWSISSPITIQPISNQRNSEGDTVSFSVSASTSHSGQTLTYFLSGQPAGVNIDPATGLVTGTIAWGVTNAGTSFSPQVTVNDGLTSNSLGFSWSVTSAVGITPVATQRNGEGDTVSFSVSASTSHSGTTLTYSLSGQPGGVSIDSSTGVISGTIAAGDGDGGGAYSPVITVSDGYSSNSRGFSWSVSSPISINAVANQTNNEHDTVSLSVSASTSHSGATLTFSAAGLPDGLSIIASSGLITGTISWGAADNGGSFFPEITVTDGTSKNTKDFTWSVTSPVSITTPADQQNTEGDTVSLLVTASTSHSGTTLTYSLADQPTGLTINTATGLISGTVSWGMANNGGGSFSPTVTVSDGYSSNTVGFSWTISSAVSITPISDQLNTNGDTVSLQVTASTAHSGTTLTYTEAGLPVGLSMNSSTGLISGTVSVAADNGGAYPVSLVVSDGVSSNTAGFTWNIGPVVQPGTFYTRENTGLTVSASVGILAGALDPDSLSLSVSQVSDPSHGTLSLSSDGSFTYTPNTDWFGPDSFEVQASDGSVKSPIVTITVQTNQLLPQSDNSFDAVATGDFNGDGNADFVAANYDLNEVYVFLGNGDGTFQTPTTFSVGTGPKAVAVGDLGNGFDDIVVANSGANTVTVLMNNGSGSFTTSQTLTVGTDPVSVALGDFLGNGNLDIAVANKGSGSVTVFLNNGSGTFGTGTNLTVGLSPSSVAAGDLTNDGYADLVVANSGSDNISVLLSNGGGTFASAVNYSVGTGPTAVVLAGFDGDNNLDVAVANGGSDNVSILLGNGDGTLGTAANYSVGSDPVALVPVYVYHDAVWDLLVGNHGSNDETILGNAGTGVFSISQTIPLGESPDSLAVATFQTGGSLGQVIDQIPLEDQINAFKGYKVVGPGNARGQVVLPFGGSRVNSALYGGGGVNVPDGPVGNISVYFDCRS